MRTSFRASFAGVLLGSAAIAHAVTVWGVDSNNSVGGDSVVKFDTSNPAGTIASIGHTGVTGSFMSGLDFDAAGTLYACSQSFNDTGFLYTIDQTNGHATLVGPLNLAASNQEMTDLTYNPATGQFVGVAFDGQNNFLYTVNQSTGAASLVGQIITPGSIFLGICADSSGQLYLEDVGGQMRTLNGLNSTAMSGTAGVSTLFSQGMTMDWSGGSAWYLAATYQTIPGSLFFAGDVRLMNNATGATTSVLGTWPLLPPSQSGQYPRYAIGDIAIKPVPEPAGLGAVIAAVVVGIARRQKRRESSRDYTPQTLGNRAPAVI
jgi:hypothetical protein